MYYISSIKGYLVIGGFVVSNDLMQTIDYDSLSLNSLLVLFNRFNNAAFYTKKKAVFCAIVKKYFEDKSSVNIYDYLLKLPFKRVENLNVALNVLNKEFETGLTNPIPDEYKEKFFSVLLGALNTAESFSKELDVVVEFRPSEILTLMKYLKDLDKLGIKDNSLRQRINVLIDTISKELAENEDKKNVEEKTEDKSIVSINNGLTEKKEAFKEIKVLKLQKSKLTKSSLYETLRVFHLYNEQDKETLVSYMLKHHWESEARNIDSVTAFDYFRKHIEYSVINRKYLNPFDILYYSFNKCFLGKKLDYFDNWFNYFNVNNFEDLMKEIEKWYMSYEGATEIGWMSYLYSLFSCYAESPYDQLDGARTDRGYYNYAQKLLLKNLVKKLDYFKKFDGASILEFCKEEKGAGFYTLNEMPYYTLEGLKEDCAFEEREHVVVDYFFKIFDKYNKRLFEYNGHFLEDDSVKFADIVSVEDRERFESFLNISKNLVIKPEDFKEIKRYITLHISDRSLKESFTRLIVWYFCRNRESLDKEWVKKVCFEKENYDAFADLLEIGYSGLFHSISDFSFMFYEIVKDDLDFSNVEDLRKAFSLKGFFWSAGKWFNLFYEKFKNECPTCYNIINEYCDGVTKGIESDILTFIKEYYML